MCRVPEANKKIEDEIQCQTDTTAQILILEQMKEKLSHDIWKTYTDAPS